MTKHVIRDSNILNWKGIKSENSLASYGKNMFKDCVCLDFARNLKNTEITMYFHNLVSLQTIFFY